MTGLAGLRGHGERRRIALNGLATLELLLQCRLSCECPRRRLHVPRHRLSVAVYFASHTPRSPLFPHNRPFLDEVPLGYGESADAIS